jgi:hypothetical protein
MTIFRRNGRYYLERLQPAGEDVIDGEVRRYKTSRVVQEFIQRPADSGLDLQIGDGRDHYLVDDYGNFQIRDDDGVALLARKIK